MDEMEDRGGSQGNERKADRGTSLFLFALFAGNSQFGRILFDLATFLLL
jgi:hypothetical protein